MSQLFATSPPPVSGVKEDTLDFLSVQPQMHLQERFVAHLITIMQFALLAAQARYII